LENFQTSFLKSPTEQKYKRTMSHDATRSFRALKKVLNKVTGRKTSRHQQNPQEETTPPATEDTTNTSTSNSPLNVRHVWSVVVLREAIEKHAKQDGLPTLIDLSDRIQHFKSFPEGVRETATQIYADYFSENATKKVQLDDSLGEELNKRIQGTTLFIGLDIFDEIEDEINDILSDILARFTESNEFDPCMKLLLESVM
jgi:hypothetical protein